MTNTQLLKRIEKIQDKLIKLQQKTNEQVVQLLEQMEDLYLDLRDGEEED